MKFKVDENLPAELVADLQAAGHEAQTVAAEGLTGRSGVLTFVRRHLPALLQADLAGHLLVVSEAGIRIR